MTTESVISRELDSTPPDTSDKPQHDDKVQMYTPDTLDRGLLMKRTEEVLGKRPFDWQIDAAAAILCGEDVVLDVGTGCGKSLCFSMPLVLHESDVALWITPLTALMIDQVSWESYKMQ